MATAIFFNGRRINIPGAYSKLDTSGISATSPAAVGIVALIGEAEGGKPLSVAPEDSDHTRDDTLLTRYREGSPLRIAGQFAFDPANDDAIPSGAQRLVCVKVNPAVQSEVTLDDADGNDSVTITSQDYGLFTTQINVDVEAGTSQGKKITVIFEDTTETFDDVGGDPILSLEYTPGVSGYATATAGFGASAFAGDATFTNAGLDSHRAADIPAPGPLRVVSDNAADTTQSCVVYGLDGANNPISETIALDGTNSVDGLTDFTSVLGARLTGAAAGTVTLSDTVLPTTLITFGAGTTLRGMVALTNAPIVPASSTIAVDTGVAGANGMIVTQSAAGVEVMQRLDFSSNAAITLTGAGKSVLYLVLGDVAAARTVTLTAKMFSLTYATFSTVQKAVDALNVLSGLAATALVSNPTTFAMSDADRPSAITILSVVANFYADTYAFIAALNNGSAFVTAARATPGAKVPANTATPVYLTGGSEGTTTISEWQQAFTLLKSRRVNIVVPLTRDPAVHALLNTHLRWRAGEGRSEANGYVGLGTADGAGETRSNIKSQIVAIQQRSISAVAQEVQRYHPDTGEREWFSPVYHAAIAAGAQAGSPIAEPLTYKKMKVLDVRNDSSWSVADDASEMIDAGLMVLENREGVGVRYIRSVTTHIADDNPIFTEMSTNESADQFAYQFRSAIEKRVGRRGLFGSAGQIKALASDEAGRMVTDEVVVAWRNLRVEQIGDVFPVSIEVAPVEPTNFIPVTIHLTRFRAAA